MSTFSRRPKQNKRCKRAFTLIETLVAIACGAVILTALVSSALFISRMNSEAIGGSSLNYKLVAMRDYIREHIGSEADEDSLQYDADERALSHGGQVILSDVTLAANNDFLVAEGGFLYFQMTYIDNSGKEEVYRFIIKPTE